jgi:putative PIG3 family NAD(P)H quinone oxidoreductase
MRAVVISRPGGPEVLELQQSPDPSPGPEEVLVRIHATAINRADLLQRRGRYPAPPGSPQDIPGLEFAGEVVTRGERVQGIEVGDRVMGILGGGGYAELVAIHERLCLPVPPGMSWAAAAATPEAFLTAYDALFHQGQLAPGEVLLLHAAGSGVGTAAAQLASVAGAQVVGLARNPAKRRRLEQLGLQGVLDPSQADLADEIRLVAGGDVDLVLDAVGASMWELNLEVLRQRGRIVVIGLLGGSRPQVDLAVLIRKRLTVIGSVLRSRPLEEKVALVQEFGRRVLPLLAAGRLRPVVDRCLDWAQAAEAHALMERNENFGKIVLTVGRSDRASRR